MTIVESANQKLAKALIPQAKDALRTFGLPAPESLELLTFSENAVFRATFETREPAVVRLHSIGYHEKPAIESELMWVEALTSVEAVRTADVVQAPTGEKVVTARAEGLPDRYAVVFEHLRGREPQGHSMPDEFNMLGRVTAHMHLHSLSWERPTGFWRFSWDAEGTLGEQGNWGQWQNGPYMDAELKATLDRTVDLITRRLSDYGTGQDRYGLIHADLRLANLLVDEGAVQVIDFDDCGDGWFLYDLAGALTFIEDDPLVPDLIASWTQGYQQIRPLTPRDLEEIPTFLMLRRLVIFAWLGSRPGTDIVLEEGPRYARVTGELALRYLATMS